MANDLQNKNQNELIKLLKEKQNELLELKFGKAVKNVKNTANIGSIKKEIARTLTALNKK